MKVSRTLTAILLAMSAAFAVACTSRSDMGPVEVKWDRDSCVRCNMAVSDRRFAAQIVGGPKNAAYKFDDFGCAIIWLSQQHWADDPNAKIWVKDGRFADDAHWLDARTAYYEPAQNTPMNYGLGAVKEKTPNSMTFEQAKAAVFEHEKGTNAHGDHAQPTEHMHMQGSGQ